MTQPKQPTQPAKPTCEFQEKPYVMKGKFNIMKAKFVYPEIEKIVLDKSDIITASTADPISGSLGDEYVDRIWSKET